MNANTRTAALESFNLWRARWALAGYPRHGYDYQQMLAAQRALTVGR